MTEEELAEEYADRTKIVDENTRAGKDCISLVQDYEGNVIDIHQRIKTAFLAGYKTQWHDLRENPDDLPEEDTKLYIVYVYIWNCNYRKYGLYLPTVCEWNKDYNRFESLDDMARGTSINVKSCRKWCELPISKGAEND